jgi:hypothetical protein
MAEGQGDGTKTVESHGNAYRITDRPAPVGAVHVAGETRIVDRSGNGSLQVREPKEPEPAARTGEVIDAKFSD